MRNPTVHRVSLLAEVHYCKSSLANSLQNAIDNNLATDDVNARLLRYLPGKADGFL